MTRPRAPGLALFRLAAPVLALVALFLIGREVLYGLYPYPYRDAIEAAAARHGLDPLFLAAVIRTESRFRPDAVSPRGAMGLMQLLPATARELAGPAFDPAELLAPETNIELGARYLAQLTERFGGRTAAALAAYNGGQANVRAWLAQGLWDGTYEDAARIPFVETRRFVQRVELARRMYGWLYGRRLAASGAAVEGRRRAW